MSELISIVIGLVLIAVLVGLAVAESALNGISRSRAEALEEDDVPGAAQLVEGLSTGAASSLRSWRCRSVRSSPSGRSLRYSSRTVSALAGFQSLWSFCSA